MGLIERKADDNTWQQDHPDFDPYLPRVGCAICGAHVQSELETPQDKQSVRAAFENDASEAAAELRRRFLEPMVKWSHEHAATHSQAEHDEHDRRMQSAQQNA